MKTATDHALIYVIGPSGAGKDSVLSALRCTHSTTLPQLHWAQRSITRPPQATGEQHEPLSMDAFLKLEGAQAFATTWRANGLAYGIRRREIAADRATVINGSRGHLPIMRAQFPHLKVVLIDASLEVLRARLHTRGREDDAAIAARLARNALLPEVRADLHLFNDGALADCAKALAQAMPNLVG